MKVLSLFDGMACGALALISVGVEIESYDAFEIDKYAVQTSSHNFPFIKHHGDVFKADFTQFEGVDLVCGGSPCTYWSIAQKNNRETEASGMGWELFQQYVRAVKEAKPKFFIYENNKSMSKAIRASIDEAFGFEAVYINSALVSAQNRQRLYWVGRRNADGTYSKVNVEQPEDRGIVLRDILESGGDLTSNEKSYCLTATYSGACAWNTIERSQRTMVAEPIGDTNGKAFCLTSNYPGAYPEHTLRKSVRTMVAEPINTTDDGDKARTLMAGYYKYGTATLITNEGFKGGTTAVAEGVNITEGEKSHTLKAQYYKNGIANFITNGGFGATAVAEPVRIPPYGNEDKARPINALYPNNCGGFEHRMFSDNPNKQQVDMVAQPIYVGEVPEHKGVYRNGKQPSQQYRVYSVDGKSVACDRDSRKHIAELIPVFATACEWNEEGKPIKAISTADGKVYTVYEVEGGQITIKGKQYPIKLKDGFYIIRKLTVRECMRLQTVPEWYEFPVSDSRAYMLLGNGWTVLIISHLIEACLSDKGEAQPELFEQMRLF